MRNAMCAMEEFMPGKQRLSEDAKATPAVASPPPIYVPRMHPLGALVFRTRFVQRLLNAGAPVPNNSGKADNRTPEPVPESDIGHSVKPVHPLVSALLRSSSRWGRL
jgi:hypothetical protein